MYSHTYLKVLWGPFLYVEVNRKAKVDKQNPHKEIVTHIDIHKVKEKVLKIPGHVVYELPGVPVYCIVSQSIHYCVMITSDLL